MNLNFYIIVIALSFCACQKEQKNQATFLSKSDGQIAILDETFEPYFSQLQIREIEAFTQEKNTSTDLKRARSYAKEKFSSAVTDFDKDEIECISFVTQQVDQVFRNNNLSLIANQPWKFIKIENWLCGGFAHTRGEYIIISQKHIEHLSKDWSSSMTEENEQNLIKKFGALLIHEKLHTLQRTDKAIFDRFYSNGWGFKQAIVKNENFITKNQVSNPDAPIAEWLIPDNEKSNAYYWIRTLLKPSQGVPQMGKDFIDVVFSIQQTDSIFTVVKDLEQNPVSMDISEFASYKNLFPVTRGLDHPNEISAYMISEYFIALIEERVPFEQFANKENKKVHAFLQWLKTSFVE